MTQEEKNLLLQDLCARLPYSLKVHTSLKPICTIFDKPTIHSTTVIDGAGQKSCNISDIKPYLFPLSSMNKEQIEELRLEHEKDVKIMANCLKKCSEGDTSLRGKNILYHAVDWCNKNHFDYRGLLPMGLAIDATGKNIY